jgi:hypothetical protein
MNREEKLEIAKRAYKDIIGVISAWENHYETISFHWDGCISIDDEFFTEIELDDYMSN